MSSIMYIVSPKGKVPSANDSRYSTIGPAKAMKTRQAKYKTGYDIWEIDLSKAVLTDLVPLVKKKTAKQIEKEQAEAKSLESMGF